jgi:CheY-like chemotaxis protein
MHFAARNSKTQFIVSTSFAARTWRVSSHSLRGFGTASANCRRQTPQQRAGATMRSKAANRVSIHRPNVWIVDAHRADYDYLLADAQAERLEIRFLATGREFLCRWFAGAPDVCIVNLQLREFNGFDVVEMIQPFPEGKIVCLLTDAYAAEDEIRALSLGVHSYLCKPLEVAVFFKLCRFRRALSEKAANEAARPAIGFFRGRKLRVREAGEEVTN